MRLWRDAAGRGGGTSREAAAAQRSPGDVWAAAHFVGKPFDSDSLVGLDQVGACLPTEAP